MTNTDKRLASSPNLVHLVPVAMFTCLSACAGSPTGDLSSLATSNAPLTASENTIVVRDDAHVGSGIYSIDPSLIELGTGNDYFVAFTTRPPVSGTNATHRFGFARGKFDGAKVNWAKPSLPTGTMPVVLPKGYASAESGCVVTDTPSCFWGSFGGRPVALHGADSKTIAMVVSVGTKRVDDTDLALLTSIDGGVSFTKRPTQLISGGTDELGNISSGKVTYYDAAVSQDGKVLWAYWKVAALPDNGFLRRFEWNATLKQFDPTDRVLAGPGGRSPGRGDQVSKPKIAVAKMDKPGVERVYFAGYIARKPDGTGPIDDEEDCLSIAASPANKSAKVHYTVTALVRGDVPGPGRWANSTTVAGDVSDHRPSTWLARCVGDGRVGLGPGTSINPNMRVPLRPALVVDPTDPASILIAYTVPKMRMLGIIGPSPTGDPDPREVGIPGFTEATQPTAVRVRRLHVSFIGDTATSPTGSLTTSLTDLPNTAWSEPDLDFSHHYQDDYRPSLAIMANPDLPATLYRPVGATRVLVTYHSTRGGYFDPLLNQYRGNVVVGAVANNSMVASDSGPAMVGSFDLNYTRYSPTDGILSTEPPAGVPWSVRSYQGMSSAAVADPLRGHFVAAWPDQRIPCFCSEDDPSLMSTVVTTDGSFPTGCSPYEMRDRETPCP